MSRELKKSTISASKKSIIEKDYGEEPTISKSKSTTLIQNKESVVTTKSADPPREFVGSFKNRGKGTTSNRGFIQPEAKPLEEIQPSTPSYKNPYLSMKIPRTSKASAGVSDPPAGVKRDSMHLVEEPKILDKSSATINSKIVNDYYPTVGSPVKDAFIEMREENVAVAVDDRESSHRASAISELKSNKSRSVSEAR